MTFTVLNPTEVKINVSLGNNPPFYFQFIVSVDTSNSPYDQTFDNYSRADHGLSFLIQKLVHALSESSLKKKTRVSPPATIIL